MSSRPTAQDSIGHVIARAGPCITVYKVEPLSNHAFTGAYKLAVRWRYTQSTYNNYKHTALHWSLIHTGLGLWSYLTLRQFYWPGDLDFPTILPAAFALTTVSPENVEEIVY